MEKKVFLGIDTSNYMTSICLIDENRKIIHEGRRLLQVANGERGLQQSEAIFQHTKNLPLLFKEADTLSDYNIAAIAVSKSPRPREDSYMPVFLSGVSVSESIAAIFKKPLYYTTHQEGHIAAGIYSLPDTPISDRFLAVHLSGGTSEILNVEATKAGYNIEKIGGTLDLHAGQLVDRIGVQLGLPFPAGKYLEELAGKSSDNYDKLVSSVKDLSFHFSGAEAEAKRRIENDESKEDIARAIENVIAVTIEKTLKQAITLAYSNDILIVGGVAQNQYIQNYLKESLEHYIIGAKLYFAAKGYSGDNAFGVANIGLDNYLLSH